ncbi:hypothetical protein V2J09_001782 [Rumex salicifolius]
MKARKIFGISLSLVLINLASILERADENLLPSVYKEVSEAFNVGPSDLGYLTFLLKFVQGLSSPLAGVLVFHYDRPTVLAFGTLIWAVSTGAVGISQQFSTVAFWRAINGVGLGIVIPALQSFIADSYGDAGRGRGFGMLSLVGSLGGIGGGVLATVMAGHEFWGIPGWRCAFMLMAIVSILIGALVFFFAVDPRTKHSVGDDDASYRKVLTDTESGNSVSVWKESWTAMRTVLKVIVMQGLVGSLPWTAMVFFTMWFELIGFDHNGSAALLSIFAFGASTGAFLGGVIADKMSRIYPYSGRIMCAQFSAFMGIPFSLFLLTSIPQEVTSWFLFSVTLLFMGLTISWCGTGTNGPMFAQVVPTKDRTMIYAFHRAFEGSFSSFAAPLVGILSEKIYGYDPKSVHLGSSRSPHEAFALSRGLLCMMALPFGLCCLLYSPLYLVFKRDRENARLASIKEDG